MKNYWLDKNKKGGFPQDDEVSKLAGCCGDFPCNCNAFFDLSAVSNNTGRYQADGPGWENGKLVDMDLWKGKCSKCGEYQWPFNDEHTMMQGDPGCACYSNSCNLDIFYASQFIQNEVLDIRSDDVCVTTYQVKHTPILPGTMDGYICLEEQCPPLNGWSFTVNSEGKFEVKRYGEWAKSSFCGLQDDEISLQKLAESNEPLIHYYDEIHYWETKLDCVTGILELHHRTAGPTPKIVASYEYDRCEV